jgi:hypothetical protein
MYLIKTYGWKGIGIRVGREEAILNLNYSKDVFE